MCYYLRVLGTWRIGGLAHGHQVAIKHHRNVDSYVAFTNKSRKKKQNHAIYQILKYLCEEDIILLMHKDAFRIVQKKLLDIHIRKGV